MMNVDIDKWKSLAGDIKGELGDGARFRDVYLIDDFTASGTTFIRFPNGEPKGKLSKFEKIIQGARDNLKDEFPLADQYTLHIHHYISTMQAHKALEERVEEANNKLQNKSFGRALITEGMLLPNNLRVATVEKQTRCAEPTIKEDAAVVDLCERYYDHDLYLRLEKHCLEAGQTDMKFGYADCALPLVLEHNTPNNAIPLLWAETSGTHGKHMQSLFFRRDRHG